MSQRVALDSELLKAEYAALKVRLAAILERTDLTPGFRAFYQALAAETEGNSMLLGFHFTASDWSGGYPYNVTHAPGKPGVPVVSLIDFDEATMMDPAAFERLDQSLGEAARLFGAYTSGNFTRITSDEQLAELCNRSSSSSESQLGLFDEEELAHMTK